MDEYIKTNDLRYRLHGPQDGSNLDLEQRYENIETGESVWRAIPVIDETHTDGVRN
tara:strand:+ start:1674 stop:1841 length:168 start_codon:yes stop_codon:yes gene_type:complete